jgi:hypothetical protein
MTTDSSTDVLTITTASGAVREIPEAIADKVVGLDSEGRIVIDQWNELAAPKKGSSLFGLTLCCNAFDKGGEDSVYCRSCYGAKPNADEGAYLFAWETDGVWGFPELDPISDKPRPVRYEVRRDAVHTAMWGIRDNETGSWYSEADLSADYIAAGVPMWNSRFAARDAARDLNDALTTEES